MIEEEQKIQEAVIPSALTEQLVNEIDSLSAKLIEERKQLKPPNDYPTRDNIEFKENAAKVDT